MSKIIIACSLSKCVHIWGVRRFLDIADQLNYDTHFLGPGLTSREIVEMAKKINPDYIAVSYRLTPHTGREAIKEFIKAVEDACLNSKTFIFAGTEPVAQIARQFNFFDVVFGGNSTPQDTIQYLKGEKTSSPVEKQWPRKLIDRIELAKPYPIIRHHFGRPTLEDTITGIEEIAEREILDVICLGTDQDAQENFFFPEAQNPLQKGAGGVPVRSEDDFRMLYQASRRGNFPLLRTYAGTRDLVRLSEVYHRTIDICSAGIPIFWYNKLDGRGPLNLEESIHAHQEAVSWHAQRDIPVEILDPHQWAMRGAHDTIFAVSAYISAYMCKQLGVGHYIAQLMFNSPGEISFKMDLAKMLAVLEMTEPLRSPSFTIYKMTRTGLLSFPIDEDEAKGHLASSTMLQMAIDPDIIHVVAYCEANRATSPREIFESCKIVKRVVESSISTPFPDMKHDPEVLSRKNHLIEEAWELINRIIELGKRDGVDWISPRNLGKCVRVGLLDAPQLKAGEIARGLLKTKLVNGAIEAVDPKDDTVLSESNRIGNI